MNKIIEEDFEWLDGHITKALTFDKDNVYKISDFIELLQKANMVIKKLLYMI